MATTLLLLRWVGEESVSIEPSSSAKPGVKLQVGVLGEFKWNRSRHYYYGEILAISQSHSQLDTLSNKLQKGQITRDELLEGAEYCEVDSTVEAEQQEAAPRKRAKKVSRATASKQSKAKTQAYVAKPSKTSAGGKGEKANQKLARIHAAKERSQHLLHIRDTSGQEESHSASTIAELQKELKEMKEMFYKSESSCSAANCVGVL